MEIDKILKQAAGKIASIGQDAEESRFLWQEAKEQLKQMESKLYLETKAKNNGMTVNEVEAVINSDDGIYDQKMAVISHESEFRKLEVKLKSWEEALNSAKMIGRLKIAEMSSLNNIVKN
jgi:hypothetical protein